MDIKVRLRLDKRTGEIEVIVEAPDSRLTESEHNRRHDQIAAEVGRILEQHPGVVELFGEAAVSVAKAEPATPETPTPETPTVEPQRRSNPT